MGYQQSCVDLYPLTFLSHQTRYLGIFTQYFYDDDASYEPSKGPAAHGTRASVDYLEADIPSENTCGMTALTIRPYPS